MKKNTVITGTIVTLGVILVISLITWYVAQPAPLLLQGEVVVRTIKISSKLTGRIDSLPVREGQSVVKGQLLYAMSTPEINAKITQATAARNAAAQQQLKAIQGTRKQEIVAAYNMWQKAEAGQTLAKQTYDRVKNLYEAGVVPSQKFDEAAANYHAAQATAKAAESQYSMALEGARPEDKAAAADLVAQAAGVITELEAYKSDSHQYAPIDAEVGTIIAERDELINAGYPVITLLDLSDSWVSFNIKETLLPKIKMDKTFEGYVPALDKKIEFKVTYMAPQADYATWNATKTRGEFDIRTFEIRATPVNKGDGLRPGMSVVVDYDDIK